MIEFEYFHRHLLVHQGCLHKCGHSLWPERKWHGRNGRGIKIKKRRRMKLIAIPNWSQRYHDWAIKEHVFPSIFLTCSVWCLNIIWKFKKHALAKKLILTNDTKISNSFHFFWLCHICSLFQLKLWCYCYPLRRCFPADFLGLKILVFHQLFKD